MQTDFQTRIFLGYIDGLTSGANPINNPAGPGNNAGVRENFFSVHRGGSDLIARCAKVDCMAEFAAAGQSCYAVGYFSDGDEPADDPAVDPQTRGAARWAHRGPELVENDGVAAASVLTMTPNGGRWLTVRVVSGTPPTRWALWGRLETEGGTLAIG